MESRFHSLLRVSSYYTTSAKQRCFLCVRAVYFSTMRNITMNEREPTIHTHLVVNKRRPFPIPSLWKTLFFSTCGGQNVSHPVPRGALGTARIPAYVCNNQGFSRGQELSDWLCRVPVVLKDCVRGWRTRASSVWFGCCDVATHGGVIVMIKILLLKWLVRLHVEYGSWISK